ncbi:MAG: S1 RNA-binding domain-containing protein [Candidatus Spechtbacterales bacterium]|nr:S1 RNA-binding domain-containing protein [Candidatus Spechtbacterales bacterium]
MKTKTENSTNGVMKDALQTNRSLFQLPHEGEIVEGKVIGKESGVLYIDLGPIGTGVVYGVEYFKVQDEIKDLEPGDTVSAKLTQIENEDGYRELSMKKAEEEKSWRYLEEVHRNQESIEMKVVDANKGGLMGKAGDLVGFLPVSQLAPANYPRVEGGDKSKILQELKNFIGQTMQVQVLDIDPKDNKVIFSERAAESDAIKESLEEYKVGDVIEGEITGIVDFGAFIKFDDMLEGLIHISELDWSLIEDPHDIVSVGDKVKAKIVDIAKDGRVSLSLKALKDNPWENIEERYETGKKIKGEVSKINPYGALVKIEEGIQGLVHVSEFTSEEEMSEKLEEDETYEFEVLSLDPEDHKIALKLVGSSAKAEESKEDTAEEKSEEEKEEKEDEKDAESESKADEDKTEEDVEE